MFGQGGGSQHGHVTDAVGTKGKDGIVAHGRTIVVGTDEEGRCETEETPTTDGDRKSRCGGDNVEAEQEADAE